MRLVSVRRVPILIGIFAMLLVVYSTSCQNDTNKKIGSNDQAVSEIDGVVNGIDTLTGMAYDEHFDIVRANCISCHSSKLITQNRATREGWKGMIDWMYATQNLKDLGANEPIILDYLAKHYAPEKKGRRANIENVEWYVLKEGE